jgi:hypothetical protein
MDSSWVMVDYALRTRGRSAASTWSASATATTRGRRQLDRPLSIHPCRVEPELELGLEDVLALLARGANLPRQPAV